MSPAEWKVRFDAELQQAQTALAEGYEGRARVCARRAASEAMREYLRQKRAASPGELGHMNLMDLTASLTMQPNLSPEARNILRYLAMRVNPGFELPEQISLIDEVSRLPQVLGLESS